MTCPGDDVGEYRACFQLKLAEACPGIDVARSVEQRRAETYMHGELEQRLFQVTM